MPRNPNAQLVFDPSQIIDALEHHALSRAMGVLTWGTWDHGIRPVEQRVAEFLAAFPPRDPVRYVSAALSRREDGSYGPATRTQTLDRFLAGDGRSGSLHEILARYGLKLVSAEVSARKQFSPADFRETARSRNQKLRALHGGVDIEPQNMDAAKAELMDKTEKKLAAEQIREARTRLRRELADKKG